MKNLRDVPTTKCLFLCPKSFPDHVICSKKNLISAHLNQQNPFHQDNTQQKVCQNSTMLSN